MSTMNGVVRAGMLEGRTTRKDPYVLARDMEMRKGRAQDLAHRFLNRGGFDIHPDGSDEWLDEYASGRSSSSSGIGRMRDGTREVTPSRSQDRERGRWRGNNECSDEDSVVEATEMQEVEEDDARGKRQRKQGETHRETGGRDR